VRLLDRRGFLFCCGFWLFVFWVLFLCWLLVWVVFGVGFRVICG